MFLLSEMYSIQFVYVVKHSISLCQYQELYFEESKIDSW